MIENGAGAQEGIETTGNLTAVNDACVAAEVPGHENLFSISDVPSSASEVFSRPICVFRGPLATGAAANTWVADINRQFITDQPLWMDKIYGRSHFAGDIVVRVEISTTPFMAGRIKLFYREWVPLNNYWVQQTGTRTGLSQLPGVEIDLAMQTAGELRVPYKGPYAGMNVLTGQPWNFGAVGVSNVISPSYAAGTPLPRISIWVSFENVKLYGTVPKTFALVTPQSDTTLQPVENLPLPPVPPTMDSRPTTENGAAISVAQPTTLVLNNDMIAVVAGLGAVIKMARQCIVATADIVPQFDRSFVKGEARAGGLVSASLMATSKAADALGAIPMLTRIMRPLGWTARVAGSLASSFGWSKPLDNTKTSTTYEPYLPPGTINSDGVDFAVNLGNQQDNSVAISTDLTRTGQDEMSFEYLNSVSTAIAAFTLSTQAEQSIVYACQMSPRALWYQAGSINVSTEKLLSNLNKVDPPAVLMGPTCALAHCFGQFRGGFRLTFKFAKTQYHTGRVMLSFCPIQAVGDASTATQVYAPANFTEASILERKLIDLREGNVFTLDIPYTSPTPYTPTSLGFGWVHMWVVESISGPATVASSIPVLVEANALPGFEFAIPVRPTIQVSKNAQDTGPTPAIYAQADTRLEMASSVPTNIVPAKMCVGEKVSSIKQLTSLPQWRLVDQATTGEFGDHLVLANPYRIRHVLYPATGQIGLSAPTDYHDFFGPWFTRYRGGMIFRALSANNNLRAWLTAPATSNTLGQANQGFNTGNFTVEKEGFLSVYVPQYGCTPYRFTGMTMGTASCPELEVPRLTVMARTPTNGSANFLVARVTADDWQYGGFVTVPPMVFTTDVSNSVMFLNP